MLDYHFNDTGMVFRPAGAWLQGGRLQRAADRPDLRQRGRVEPEAGVSRSATSPTTPSLLYRYNYDNRQAVRLIDPGPEQPDRHPALRGRHRRPSRPAGPGSRCAVAGQRGVLAQRRAGVDRFHPQELHHSRWCRSDGQPTGEPHFSASLAWPMPPTRDSGRLRFRAPRPIAGDPLQRRPVRGRLRPVPAVPHRRTAAAHRPAGVVEFAADRWTVAAYGNNVFDNRYVTGLNTYGAGGVGVVGAGATPLRTYGLEDAEVLSLARNMRAHRHRRCARLFPGFAFCADAVMRLCMPKDPAASPSTSTSNRLPASLRGSAFVDGGERTRARGPLTLQDPLHSAAAVREDCNCADRDPRVAARRRRPGREGKVEVVERLATGRCCGRDFRRSARHPVLRFFHSARNRVAQFALAARVRLRHAASRPSTGWRWYPSYRILGEGEHALGDALDPVYPKSRASAWPTCAS